MDSNLRNYNPGVIIVAEHCAVCNMPVREEDDPTPIYSALDGPRTGYIHGSFDCTDAETCAELREVTDGSSWTTQPCRIPEGHLGECFWGEPA
jgi:hypothetical protein